ncbi:MAG: hypothetical protein WBP81_17895 [Solirubrobacteraceae bacterium]
MAVDDELVELRSQNALVGEENAVLLARIVEQDAVIEELRRQVNRRDPELG